MCIFIIYESLTEQQPYRENPVAMMFWCQQDHHSIDLACWHPVTIQQRGKKFTTPSSTSSIVLSTPRIPSNTHQFKVAVDSGCIDVSIDSHYLTLSPRISGVTSKKKKAENSCWPQGSWWCEQQGLQSGHPRSGIEFLPAAKFSFARQGNVDTRAATRDTTAPSKTILCPPPPPTQ